jgi:hypothetical protein
MVGGWGVWPRAAAQMLAATAGTGAAAVITEDERVTAGTGAAAAAAGVGGDGGSSGGAGGDGGVGSVEVEFKALANCEVLYLSRWALARCCLQALPGGGGSGGSGGDGGGGGGQSGVGPGGRWREVEAMEVEAWRSAQALAARFCRGRAAVVSTAKGRAREQQQQQQQQQKEEEEEEERRRRQRLLQRPRRRQRHSAKPVATLAGAPRRPVGRATAAAAPAAGAAGAAVSGAATAAAARGALPPRTARKLRSGSAPRPGRKVVLADANRRTAARATSKTKT